MIRGFVALVSDNSPLPDTPSSAEWWHKRAEVKLSSSTKTLNGQKSVRFAIIVEETSFYFKVQVTQNIRAVDKGDISRGILRIGFFQPKLDLVIACAPREVKTFADTVLAAGFLTEDAPCDSIVYKCLCELDLEPCPEEKLHCLLTVNNEHKHGPFNPSCSDSSSSTDTQGSNTLGTDVLDKLCNNLKRYTYDNLTAKFYLQTLRGITVNRYPYLTTITAVGIGLVNISEALGSLPCLSHLTLSNNRLGEATDWNWLTSPLMKENLLHLSLDQNELCDFPEAILRLRNLVTLNLSRNHLTKLPDTAGRLKKLRTLDLGFNRLRVMPLWTSYMKSLHFLTVKGNLFHLADSMYNNIPLLRREDFKIEVPSLLQAAANMIITTKFPYWVYNIPAMLADYLETAYYCRCGCLVFRDTVVQVVHCRVTRNYLANYGRIFSIAKDEKVATFPIGMRCCSYKCFKRVQHEVNIF